MSNEELERKMAFIVEQQAQFASDIQQREVQGQLQAAQLQTETVVAGVQPGIRTGTAVARYRCNFC